MARGAASWLRDGLNAAATRRMVRLHQFPDTIERSYWHGWEYARDAARLERLGYDVESEADNDPYVTATLPAAAGGTMGLLSRVVQRRVPTIHVVFRRRHASP